ncbi:MAG: TonB C-terminal domain-containing protein [Kiritimatiellae bacterium]|nr:TonB C-terminal domain-containing protein [Kiritimatiellia bacterium]
MELWREEGGGDRPRVISAANLVIAFALHFSLFAVFWVYSALHDLFRKDEEIIPIDLTVVVNENLDGKENEPPPLKNPDPPPPPDKPKPKPKPKEPEKPKELEKIVTNIVEKVDKKEEKNAEPEKKKPEKPKEPEKQKKTAKELREERIRQMRQLAKTVNKPVTIEVRNAKESGDGRTDRRTLTPDQIRNMLNQGYKPGTSNQLAANEEQLALSLIKAAFEAKWDKPPWTDTLRPMVMRVWFGNGGRIMKYSLEKSSGDARADQSIKSAASRVGAVPALPAAFIDKYRSSGVPVRFTVKPQ